MSIFSSDLADQLILQFNSSRKESLQQLGGDEDEKDKILLNSTRSLLPVELRVDYSDFSNHIFFNSAYTAAKLAYSRLLDYPSDGTYRDFFEWQKLNSGYENWFFDNYPKQQGFLSLTSGANGPSVFLKDYENKINISTSSVTVEFISKPYENFDINPVFTLADDQVAGFYENYIFCYYQKTGATKYLFFDVSSGSTNSILSFSCDQYVSSSNFYSFVYDKPNLLLKAYVNGKLAASSSATVLSTLAFKQPVLNIGFLKAPGGLGNFYHSGCLDEFRLWTSNRSEFIQKNYFKTIFANPSASLKVYYKFNEDLSYQNKIIDYSGNGLQGQTSGSFSILSNRVSGTLGAWFKDSGVPILDSTNSRVINFTQEQEVSGSAFDQTNKNYIFKLVPQFFVDGEESDDQKLFLLLLARHYDRLKLYIEHLSNVHNINLSDSDDTPDRLINLIAENYGIDLGDVYDSSDPLQYYFGEGVLSSGSLDSSIQDIKNQLKRNVLNNIIYILKTKTTKNSITAALRALGVDENVLNINEYSLFSGGFETSRNFVTTENRVAKLSSSTKIFINNAAYQISGSNTFQTRVLFNTASSYITSSIFTLEDSGALIFGLRAERENSTSISGVLKLSFKDSGSVIKTLSSSLLPLYNGNWNDISYTRTSGTAGLNGIQGFFISQLDYDQLFNSQSVFTASSHLSPQTASISLYLGTSGSNNFDGYIHEFRAWKNYNVSGNIDLIKKWNYDYESTEVVDFNNDISNLLVRYKLNDFTASAASTSGTVHDFISGLTSQYWGMTTSSYENFPGKYIPRYVQGYSYDLNINNSKIRNRNEGRRLNKSEQTLDVPFVTVDVSPTVSLSKEIIKYFGNLEKFSNVIGNPFNKFRSDVIELHQYRYNFFDKRLNSKIDFTAFINLIKWLDSNFSYLLAQLIPLEVVSSISNYVIEPHVLEFNKVKYEFPYKVHSNQSVLTASVTAIRNLTASAVPSFRFADPGRFGAAISASGYVPQSYNFSASFTASSGVNFQFARQQKILNLSMSNNSNMNFGVSGSLGNQFYNPIISSSNYLRDVLNVNTSFFISASSTKQYNLSSSQGPGFSAFWSSSLNAVQDQRWMWLLRKPTDSTYQLTYDVGIGYGGGWGQLWNISNKSKTSNLTAGSILTSSFDFINMDHVSVIDDKISDTKTVSIWPEENSYDGVLIYVPSQALTYTIGYTGSISSFNSGLSASTFGPTVDIEGYKSVELKVVGSYNTLDSSGIPGPNPGLKFLLEYQFSDDGIFANYGYETIISSSVESSGNSFKTSYISYLNELKVDITQGQQETSIVTTTFNLPVKRNIPNSKFMRIKLTAIWQTVTDVWIPQFVRVFAKGTLSKNTIGDTTPFEIRSI